MRPAGRSSEPWSAWAGALLLAAGCCIGAGVRLARMDFAGLVEQRIGQAKGAVGGEAGAWLRTTDFAGGFFWLAGILVIAGVVVHVTRTTWRRWVERGMGERDGEAVGRWIAWGGCVAVGLRYFPSLAQGFFRYDDFELLAVAREVPLGDAVWLPHGDHFMPLTRVLFALGWKIFGVAAWPYNVAMILSFCAVVIAGCALLNELRVSAAARVGYVVLVVFWAPWAELLAGYYVLSTYLMIAALGMVAVWAYLRWLKEPCAGWVALTSGSAVTATLIDISGWYVPAAVAVFLGANGCAREKSGGVAEWLTRHRALLGAMAAGVGLSLAAAYYSYGVLHRGLFLSMAGEGGGRSVARLAAEFGYLFDVGLLVSMVVPFVYARLPIILLTVAGGGVLAVWLAFSVAAVRAGDRRQRIMLGALACVVAGACLMVNLGRPSESTVVVRWAAKHVCPAYLWLCLLLATGWDVIGRSLAARARARWGEFTLIALTGFVGAQGAFGLLGMAVEFPPFGYPAELRDAGRRRDAVEKLRNDVVGKIRASADHPITAPALDGAFVVARLPSLFEYNLSHYAPFIEGFGERVNWVRNPAMQPWHTTDVKTVPVLRKVVSPEFLVALAQPGALREFYFGTAALRGKTRRAGQLMEGGELGPGSAVVVQAGAWDPEEAGRMVLSVERAGGGGEGGGAMAGEIVLGVIFRGDAMGADWQGTVAVPAKPGMETEVDLKQVYAFALSRRVENLRVVLPTTGRYWVRLAEVRP